MGAYDYEDTSEISGVKIGTGSKLITEAGTGITTATGGLYKSSVFEAGGLVKTQVFIDVTGLTGSATVGDIIGVENAANCHLGQITYAQCGTIVGGDFICLESPATSDPDIDIYSSDIGTGTEDVAITDAALGTETQLVNSGDWVNGTRRGFSAFPADGDYLYLVIGTATAGAYTAGKALITLYGYRA